MSSTLRLSIIMVLLLVMFFRQRYADAHAQARLDPFDGAIEFYGAVQHQMRGETRAHP